MGNIDTGHIIVYVGFLVFSIIFIGLWFIALRFVKWSKIIEVKYSARVILLYLLLCITLGIASGFFVDIFLFGHFLF